MAKNKRKLYKTIVIVWSEHDLSNLDIAGLATQVEYGNAVCVQKTSTRLDASLCPRRDIFPESNQCGAGCGHDHG